MKMKKKSLRFVAGVLADDAHFLQLGLCDHDGRIR